MSEDEKDLLEEFQEEIEEQAESAEIETHIEETEITQPDDFCECSNEKKAICATKHGPRAVENKILVSISENINTMAEAIKESEDQKHTERAKCVNWFIGIMVFLVLLATILIVADTFYGVAVRIEFLVSVILAILADVFAIVHTLVKYMTNTENYDAYGKLIDSLLKHIEHK